MKITQSVSDIESFAKRQAPNDLEMKTRKNPSGKESLLENLERHKVRDAESQKDRNYLARDRAIKYQKIIIKSVSEKLKYQLQSQAI